MRFRVKEKFKIHYTNNLERFSWVEKGILLDTNDSTLGKTFYNNNLRVLLTSEGQRVYLEKSFYYKCLMLSKKGFRKSKRRTK